MRINQLLAVSPYMEVLVRNAYWRSDFLIRRISARRNSRTKKSDKPRQPQTTISRVVENLDGRGVKSGDILVVHSAFGSVSIDATPRKVNEALKELVGASGTLVMPAIPHFEGMPAGTRRITTDVSKLVLDYDPSSTPAWTGALPNDLLKVSGAKRSLHPLNSVVAWGPHAEDMLKANLEGDRPLPCGPGSSWNYCRERGAKIASIGVDMAHSLTMIHVSEDLLGDHWCVPGWYRERQFRIRTALGWAPVVVRERHPRWAMHYAERTLDKDLRHDGLLTVEDVDGVSVGLLDSARLVDYLNARNSNGYPYYWVPHARSQ